MNLALLILFVLIQLADVALTYVGLRGGASEAAPLGKSLFARIGFWPTVLLIKGAGIALAVAATLFIRNAYWFTGLLCIGGLWVLWHNWRVVRAQRR